MCTITIIYYTLSHQTKQSEAYQQNSEVSVVVLQVKFSKHFSNFWQDEVHSAHLNKKQSTIFSSCFWHKDLCESAIVISDDLHHCRLFSSKTFHKKLWNLKITISKSCIYGQMVQRTNFEINLLLLDCIGLKAGLM